MITRESNLASGFPRSEATIVAFVGAGGKTSAIRELAQQESRGGASVLVLTTTRMFADQPPGDELSDPGAEIPAGEIRYYGQIHDESESESKLGPPPETELDHLLEEPPADRILIEADGADRGWLKLHRDYEPVVPGQTDAVVSVVNLRGIGKQSSPDWIHRWEDYRQQFPTGERFGVGKLEWLLRTDHGYQRMEEKRRWLLLVGSPPEGSETPADELKRFSDRFWNRWDRVCWWNDDSTVMVRRGECDD